VHRLADLVPDGLIARRDLAAVSSTSSVQRWLRRGDVVELQPGLLVLAARADDWVVRARAATLWSGGPLSHQSALRALRLVPPTAGPLHVTVPAARLPRGRSDVVVHRSDRRLVTVRSGVLEVVAPERSLVDAWAWAHLPRRNPRATQEAPLVRQALIEAVRSREVSVRAVRTASGRLGPHPGKARLMQLLDLIGGGCESELEIWGVLHVLPGPPMLPAWVQQHRVLLHDGRRLKVDAAYVEARVAIELDGAAFHGSREDRERDLRRDTALAAVGWIVLRFSYARLMADPEGCRQEIAAAVLARLIR
jgi:hypothetical protein